MFTNKTPVEPTVLEKQIEKALLELDGHEADSPEYKLIVEQIEKLHKLKDPVREPKKRISPDALLMVGGNLAGILLILQHERVHVVTSKALGFVLKAR